MTPAGTSNELDVQNGWEENTHTHTILGFFDSTPADSNVCILHVLHSSTGTYKFVQQHTKVVIAHGSVEFCEATPIIGLADESKESLYGGETDRNLRSA